MQQSPAAAPEWPQLDAYTSTKKDVSRIYVALCAKHRSNGAERKPRTGCGYCEAVYEWKRTKASEETGWPIWRWAFNDAVKRDGRKPYKLTVARPG